MLIRTVVFALAVFFIQPSSSSAETVVRVGGIGSSLGMMKQLAAAFGRANPGVRIEVLPSIGSGGAMRGVYKGKVDVGIIGRAPYAGELMLGLSVTEFAMTPFVFVTEANVEFSEITESELVRLLNGDRKTWPDGSRVRLVLRPAGDSDTMILKGISPSVGAALSSAVMKEGMLVALTDQEAADLIEKTPGAFGFSTLTQIISEKRRLNMLRFNGVTPGAKTFSDGSYPLCKRFSLVIGINAAVEARRFSDFILSPDGIRIIEKSGNRFIGPGMKQD